MKFAVFLIWVLRAIPHLNVDGKADGTGTRAQNAALPRPRQVDAEAPDARLSPNYSTDIEYAPMSTYHAKNSRYEWPVQGTDALRWLG